MRLVRKFCSSRAIVERRIYPHRSAAYRKVGSDDVPGKFYGQATKGVRWMPWRQKAMKDVASCDKPRGAASRL